MALLTALPLWRRVIHETYWLLAGGVALSVRCAACWAYVCTACADSSVSERIALGFHHSGFHVYAHCVLVVSRQWSAPVLHEAGMQANLTVGSPTLNSQMPPGCSRDAGATTLSCWHSPRSTRYRLKMTSAHYNCGTADPERF